MGKKGQEENVGEKEDKMERGTGKKIVIHTVESCVV